MQAAARILGVGSYSKRNVNIFSNSQAFIKGLSSNVVNSKTVYRCHKYINEIAKRYDMATEAQWYSG